MHRFRHAAIGAALVLITIAILYGLLSYWTPRQFDDYMFMGVYRQYAHNFDLGAWADYFSEIRNNDNCRLSNALAAPLLLFSPFREVLPWLTGIMVAAMVWAVCRFSDISSSSGRMLAVVWAVLVIFLPWRNNLFVADYALNYIYGDIVTFAAIGISIRGMQRGYTPGRFAASLFIVAIAGAWHEGFALTSIAGLIAASATLRKKLNWQSIIVITTYTASALIFFLSPGMMGRMVREHTSAAPAYTFKLIADLSLVIITLGYISIMLTSASGRARLRQLWREPAFAVFFWAMILGSIISIMVTHTARTAFYPELCAAIVFLSAAAPLVSRTPRILAAGLFALCVAHGIYANIWQKRLYDYDRNIKIAIEESDTGTAFFDIIMPESVPPTTLFFPARTTWTTAFQYQFLDIFYNSEGRKLLSVVPEALIKAPHEGTLLPPGEIYRTGDALWSRQCPDVYEYSPAYYDITLVDGRKLHGHPSYFRRFVSVSGDTLTYIKPHKIAADDVVAIEVTK